MAIELFEHNQTAYLAAVDMLAETGKAAVIHPTGTGKSFIGFKLCEEYPDKRICWLSPSSYIFETQIENLKKATNGYSPQNITFFTYAKLMLLEEAEIKEICPDFIVLDEFHRCGAQMWGAGVKNLLAAYPEAPLLGLSATAIRYLDNQRDMADELFDGNVAAEMTLGEAIVRGILNPPKYILSAFSYEEDLKKYQKKIRRAKNHAARDAAEVYYEALRRALEQADGLDEVFYKHMPSASGKYIVFCANMEHMRAMIALVPEWFAKVDTNPHVYSAYSDDPATSQEFAHFKADSGDHLKLLFCIDMLNEGVHVDDVDGVILLRPTISPIIYKQQIGRALSANKSNDVVIFDIVMNIENLYSISSVEQEMEVAVNYYRSLGEGGVVVNERFQIVDEARDCRQLFERLNDSLAASWDLMYQFAKSYYEEHGDLEVPRRYKTEGGHSLGNWLGVQRKVRKGLVYGILTTNQIQRLDAIGMRWGYVTDLSWEQKFEAAKAFYEENGHLDVQALYVTESGITLGSWIANMRACEAAGIRPKYLTPERKAQLESIGMIWDRTNYIWERNYRAACAYYEKNQHLDIPTTFVTPDGLRLGTWIARQRKVRAGEVEGQALDEEQLSRLESIGMIWEDRNTSRWETGYRETVRYIEEHGNLDMPYNYVTDTGFTLAAWIRRQRYAKSTGTLSAPRKNKLDKLGVPWEVEDGWQKRYDLVCQYYEEHGTTNISQTVVMDGIWIGKWIKQQKQAFFSEDDKTLTPQQRELLSKLPLNNMSNTELRWEAQYQSALDFYEKNHHMNVPTGYCGPNGKRLDNWLKVQKQRAKATELTATQKAKLTALGIV